MNPDDPKEPQSSGENDSGLEKQPSRQPSDSTPSDDVQAPKSNWFKKSSNTPDDDVEAPKSQWLTEGFDPGKPEQDDE